MKPIKVGLSLTWIGILVLSLVLTACSPNDELVLRPNTVVADQESEEVLTSVTENQEVLTFTESTPQLDGLELGDVLVMGPTDHTPEGLLRKVTGIEHNGGVVVNTEFATMEDAIEEGTIMVTAAITATEAQAAALGVEGVRVLQESQGTGFTVELNRTVSGFTFSGQLRFLVDPVINVEVTYLPPGLKELEFTIETDELLNLQVQAEEDVDVIDERIELLPHPIRIDRLIFPFGFPVYVVIYFTPVLVIEGDLSGQLQARMEYEAQRKAGLHYKDGSWGLIKEQDSHFNGEAALEMQANLRASVGPEVKVKFYSVVGPTGNMFGYLEFESGWDSLLWWELYGGLRAELGIEVELPILGRVAGYGPVEVMNFRRLLAEYEEVPSLSVVINEIAWMGTRANSADEWIELYNNTDEEIDLSGWILKADDGTPNIELSGIILSDEFFLLEQGSDNTIKGIPADQIYTGALNNEGEKLELFDAYGNLIDLVDCSEKWFNGDRENRVSMERIDSSQPGSVSDNWESNNLITRRGEDADGKKINGMPGAENSVSKSSTKIFDGLPFSEGFDEIFLTKFGSPYVVKRAIVPENKTLIFGQGAVVQFYDDVSRITVKGTLKAIGTEDEKIVFTSRFDDEYGGSGGAADGDWNQIYFSPTSTDSELDNVIIRYGGAHRSDWDQYRVSAVMVEQSSVILKNSVFEKNKGKGLYFYLMDCSVSASVIDNVQFLDHQKGLNSDIGVALRAEGGSLEIKNSFLRIILMGFLL